MACLPCMLALLGYEEPQEATIPYSEDDMNRFMGALPPPRTLRRTVPAKTKTPVKANVPAAKTDWKKWALIAGVAVGAYFLFLRKKG